MWNYGIPSEISDELFNSQRNCLLHMLICIGKSWLSFIVRPCHSWTVPMSSSPSVSQEAASLSSLLLLQ